MLLFEASFRLYLIDFYSRGFEFLNSDFEQKETEKALMIVGDSFSAFKEGYPQTLSDSLSSFNIRNISVPGTSIREQYLFGRHHIKKEKPDVLIFQFYVGNDLFSWSHLPPEGDISFLRNNYWNVSEYLWSLNFINYRLAYLRAKNLSVSRDSSWHNVFNPEKFSKRDFIYFRAEPDLVENAAYLANGRFQDLESYMHRMDQLFGYADSNCKIYIVLVPHAAQVNEIYQERTKKLGAEFSSEFQVGQEHYPLFDQMVSFFSGDNRVEVLNPISIFKESEELGMEVYFKNDSHLTLEGQRVLGHFLLEHLKKD
ncbi:MAG: hypothetical protein Roseis3KO_01820 [Roseivirga sp.]